MIRAAAKLAMYRLGALSAYHRLRNRHTLTVLMFHRVLPAAERDRSAADPLWTVTTEQFEEILAFADRHYSLVGLDDVLASRARRAPLPPRALLVTFDDGWHDNLEHALPILRRHAMPAAIFAASDAIEETGICWWQEVVLWALRHRRKGLAELWGEASESDADGAAEVGSDLRLLVRYGRLDPARRDDLLRPLARELEQRQMQRHMLDSASFRRLASAGIGVGVHGAAHLPLTALANSAADLAKARRRIALHTGAGEAGSLSFPHGSYDARVVEGARRLGFELLFTSDAVVNSCPGGWLETDLVGKIPIFPHEVTRPDGGVSEPNLATWLFLRPRERLTCAAARTGAPS